MFFQELKSTLGFHQYQFRDFQCVENWCELTLLAFLYLENLRARQLARRGLTACRKRGQGRRCYLFSAGIHNPGSEPDPFFDRLLSEKDKKWWRHQRTHGLCQAVRFASQQNELQYLAERLETSGGIQKLKRLLPASSPTEYRATL